jgi:hypothetical protein
METFFVFLSQWLAGNILNSGARTIGRVLQEKILYLQRHPGNNGWNQPLTPEQEKLLEALKATKPIVWKRWFARMRTSAQRPIVVLGPSGVGKTIVGFHLAGIKPRRAVQMSDQIELQSLVAQLKAVDIHIAPGSLIHGEGPGRVFQKIVSDNPPKLVIIVIAGGYHATARATYIGDCNTPNYARPGSGRKALASSIEEFTKECREKEEIAFLEDLLDATKGLVRGRIPWVITVVNKRDLWQARGDSDEILKRYVDEESPYGSRLFEIRREWGLGQLAAHDCFPAYLDDNGFTPDPKVTKRALTQADILADAMVLRALVFLRYTEGALRYGI